MTHPKLKEALNLLGFDKSVGNFSSTERVDALFQYLNLAGYLSPHSLAKAVDYLNAERPLAGPSAPHLDEIKRDLIDSCNPFNLETFLEQFAYQPYFSSADIVELIVAIQQTAFDRKFGQERDRLSAKPWMLEKAEEFIGYATRLGLGMENPPSQPHYIGIGIMGAASFRVTKRVNYFKDISENMSVTYGGAWALSGDRELSKGLDEDPVMHELAIYLKYPFIKFTKKKVGVDVRDFLVGITETHLVNFLLMRKRIKNIKTIECDTQEHHWRATTQQNARAVVPEILKQAQNISNSTGENIFYFMIIAEQPYSDRMALQVQREFNEQIRKQNLAIQIIVEGCGQGLDEEVLKEPQSHLRMLANINSAAASLLSEQYNNAKLEQPQLFTRNSQCLMFSTREQRYAKNISALPPQGSQKQFSQMSSISKKRKRPVTRNSTLFSGRITRSKASRLDHKVLVRPGLR